MLLYVNFFDNKIKTTDENPTIGLILCTNKNDAVAEYVLGEKQKQIFTSRYQHELPSVEELKMELKREMALLAVSPDKNYSSLNVMNKSRSKKGRRKASSK
jgi:hypothetical protein